MINAEYELEKERRRKYMFFRKSDSQGANENCPRIQDILGKITVNEQSSIRLSAEKVVYFDPFGIKEAPHDADMIFITHPHFDHFSPEDIGKVRKDDTVFIAPASAAADISKVCPNEALPVLLEPGDARTVCGIPVEAVPAYNVNKAFHPKKNGWLGYVVTV